MSKVDSAPPPQANPPVRPPRQPRPPQGPWNFVLDSVRMAWRWLTRMKTALYLLGMLGVLTLVATMVPQEPNVAATVADWRSGAAGPGQTVSQLIDLFGLYDTYGSPVFLALLLLLFTSLTACLIPRIRAFIRLVRRGRPPISRNLSAHPHHVQLRVPGETDDVHQRLRTQLDRRWRVRDAHRPATAQIAAERGIVTREGGSLLFHLSFYVLLVGVVLGQLFQFVGQVGVVEGAAFHDTPSAYWTSTPGRWFAFDDHANFRMELDEFRVEWVRTVAAGGEPSLFEADVTVVEDDGHVRQDTISPNVPMVIDGFKVHLLDWGLAPTFRVSIDDEVVWEGVQTPQVTSQGFFRSAVKAPDVPDGQQQLGLQIGLYPYAPANDEGGFNYTGAPWPDAPVAVLAMWRGDLGLVGPQNVNLLDTDDMELVATAELPLGESVQLPGDVTVELADLDMWAGFQVSHRPTVPLLLAGAGLLLLGLVPALYAYRRRLWVQVEPDADGDTIVTVAGRAFQRPDAFRDEFDDLVAQWHTDLRASGPPPQRRPDPDGD